MSHRKLNNKNFRMLVKNTPQIWFGGCGWLHWKCLNFAESYQCLKGYSLREETVPIDEPNHLPYMVITEWSCRGDFPQIAGHGFWVTDRVQPPLKKLKPYLLSDCHEYLALLGNWFVSWIWWAQGLCCRKLPCPWIPLEGKQFRNMTLN